MASNYVYGTILRHASSAGGTLATDEDWVIKSWYGEMHRMTIDEILTVGVGMSPSQKTMCVRLSIAAYNRGVFPDHYFMEHEGTKVIVPDVGNFDLWFLLHEITRKTYASEFRSVKDFDWRFCGMPKDGSTAWDLMLIYCDDTAKAEYHHWRGNTDAEASRLAAERKSIVDGKRDVVEDYNDWYDSHDSTIYTPESTENGTGSADYDAKTVNDLLGKLKLETETVDSREELFAQREAQAAEREKEVAYREKQFAGREKDVAEREKDVAGREKDVVGREKDVVGREKEVTTREKDVAEREKAVANEEGRFSHGIDFDEVD